MAGLKLALFIIYLFVFDPSLAGLSCYALCEMKYTGYCRNRGGVSITARINQQPCATCNTTGQADENQLGCLPSNLRKLQVAGHSDRNGKLKPLPSLAQLRILVLGPGHIVTVERGAFSAVPELWGLSMGKNGIKTVESWFAGSSKLEKLVLSWNAIDEIKENAFQPLKRLYYLEMTHNRLRSVEECHFASLTNLEYLHLSYNSISHIAWESFSGLSKLKALSLDNNKLLALSTEWLQGISAGNGYYMNERTVTADGNPFRCTCALGSLKSLGSRVYDWHKLQCNYPPSLSGRKIARVSTEEMPCPPPTAKISLQDHGAKLMCEVFWEKQPEIRWLDPGGRAIGGTESLVPCGGSVSTSLEHEVPTTQCPEEGTAYSTDDPGLPYIGKSTSTLRLSPQAYRCWVDGSFRCDVQSAAGDVFAILPLAKLKEESKQDQRQEHTLMAAVYTTTPAQRKARMTDRIVKTTKKNTQQKDTASAEHAVMQAVYTTTPTKREARMTEGIVKTTYKNTAREGTAPAAKKPTRQSGRTTEGNTKTTDKKSNYDDAIPADDDAQWHTIMMVIYIISACLAVIVLYVVKTACCKCCRKRYILHVRAAAAIGGMQLQNIQPPAATPTTGNPEAPQHTYEDIPDDTPIDPYAETTRLENPMYGADVTGPKDATSISDPRPRPNGPANSGASSRPQGSSQAPVPPPRPGAVVPANFSGSYYPPSTETTQAKPKGIPDPLPRTNKHVNVSSQPQGAVIPKKKPANPNVSVQPKAMAASPRHNPTTDPRGSEMDQDEDDEGPNIYLDLNGSSGLNSNVSSQTRGLKTATTLRHKPTTDPRSLDMDEEEEVDGPNIYLDLNGPPRHSGSEVPQAEDVPDPLPRTNKYVNSNVTSKHRGAEMPQTEKIPDPLPRIHTYVNSNVTSKPRGAEMPQTEKIPDPLPRIHTYVNSNVTSQPRGTEMPQTEKIPDPLPRIHTYVNSNVTSQPRGTEMSQEEKIPDPLPRIHTQSRTVAAEQDAGALNHRMIKTHLQALSGSRLPCATCNTTGQADGNQLGCLPSNLRKLQVVGHSDRNGKLKPLPSLAQLRLLLLGPGHIVTVEHRAFSAFPELWGLSMAKNAIKTVENWFAGSSKLEKLILSWNKVDEIKENAFQPLKRLYYLEMTHNRLRSVEEWHFASLTNLEYLHLSYNSISHIARKSFSGLSKLKVLSLGNNKLSSLSTEWLQGISVGNICRTFTVDGNPFRCTCALGNLKSLGSRVSDWHKLQCSYPPSLYGRKIARLSTEKMLCPHPTANISLQDHGTTLVCEVFWEKKPEIGWLDPGERAIGRGESLDPCGGPVTTSLEHEIPTTEYPEGGTAYSTDDPGLPYIGKSISTLRMSPQAYRCWAEGSFRCDVQSAAGNVFASVPLTKLKEKSEQDQRQEHTVMPAVYTTTPAQRNARMTERIVKTTDKNTPRESTTQAEHTVMAAVYTMTNTQRNARMMEGIILHLSYNSISHIARESFSGLSKLKALSLDNNKLSSLSTEWLQGISAGNHYNIMGGGTVTADGNPFRCTCALGSLKSLGSRVNEWHELQCTYPPSLYGRKIARLSTEKMLCPHPTANISLQDHGTTLVCEVFWEKKPEIGWLDPGERAIGRGESLDPCGGPVTTSLEHEIPTTEYPEGGTAYSTDDPGLPYIGKSISTLRMSPQAYRCWAEGSFRCDVQSAAGNVFASVPLTKLKEKSEQDQRQEHTVMPAVYTTTPAQRNARMTERIVKTTDKNTPRESTTQAEHTVMAAVYTMTNTQRNARMMEGIVKTTDKNTPREGTASTAEKSTRQSGRMTERNTKTTDRKSNQDDTVSADDDAQWHTIMMVIYIISACLAVIVLYVVKNAFLKCCRKRYVYHVRAAAAIGGMQLQNIQPPAATPTTGNPEAPQHTYEDIPDDTPIDPYAETTRLENPMYGADVTGPRDATSISDPRPRPNGPANSGASSRPQGSSQAPVPPPRPVVPANFSSSYYPPSTETTQAKPKGIPDPLPRTNKHANSNVSLQPQGAKKKKKKTQAHVNSNVSLQPKGLGKATKSQHKSTKDPRSLGMNEDEDDDGPNIYLDLNGSSGLNSNVSSQTRGLKTANTPRHKPTTDPRSLDMDEEEEVDGPNIYLDLNGPPRQSGSEVPQAEDVPDPLPRTNKYVNSNVTPKHRGAEMPQTEKIPDPLPRIHTYVNSNVTSQPRGAELWRKRRRRFRILFHGFTRTSTQTSPHNLVHVVWRCLRRRRFRILFHGPTRTPTQTSPHNLVHVVWRCLIRKRFRILFHGSTRTSTQTSPHNLVARK
uniref:LRRCT domain-containing protein n=1 Tax=Branchiostoma floridae TaxID=7739 RepID=C3YR81_BRAFL|eukprot:XP_002601066.1 hypothetical protein BRAFLDRAFT_75502 [Branchiostoma floridae]